MPDGTIYPNKPINMGGRKISGALTEESDSGNVLATKGYADTKLNWRKEFVEDSDPAYNVNDLVEFEDALYICNTDATIGSPTDYPSRWDSLPGGGGGAGYLYAEVVGDGSESTFTINHGLGTSILAAPQGWEISTGIAVELKYQIIDDNTVEVSVSPGYEPDTNNLRVVISSHAGGTPIIVPGGTPEPLIWEADFFEGSLRDIAEEDMVEGKRIKWLPSLAGWMGGGSPAAPNGYNIGATFYMRARQLSSRKWLWMCEGVAESQMRSVGWFSGEPTALEYPNWDDNVLSLNCMAPILRRADSALDAGSFAFLPRVDNGGMYAFVNGNESVSSWRFNFGFTGRGYMKLQLNHIASLSGYEPADSLFVNGTYNASSPYQKWSPAAKSYAESNSVMQTVQMSHPLDMRMSLDVDPTYYSTMKDIWVDAAPESIIVDYTPV